MFPRLPSRCLAGMVLISVLAYCDRAPEGAPSAQAPILPPVLTEEQKLEHLVAAEEWILAETPQLKKLGEDLKRDGRLPGGACGPLFASGFRWTALKAPQPEAIEPGAAFLRYARCVPESILREANSNSNAGVLWTALLIDVSHWEQADFKFVSAKPLDTSLVRMRSLVSFEGLAKLRNDHWRTVSGEQELTWERGYDDVWRIIQWDSGDLSLRESPALLFAECLEDSLAEPADLQTARRSYHEENLIRLFTEGKFTTTDPVYARYQDLESSHQHPGLAVVDIEGDGWDELYVMGRWGKNQLFRRRPDDGRYEDVASEVGLDLDGYCNAALFADFDNDGDPDVFIGRSLKRSLYLENVRGRFIDRSEENVAAPLPYLVSSISAADYNNDGFLDVYLALYGPTSKETPVEMWAKEFFPPSMTKELLRRSGESHRYLEMLGPPNLLLENKEGRFIISSAAGTLAEWRNTYQSAWADFDADGDPDLYVCNDFAPDALFRNDAGSFVEVSQEMAGKGMMGFGMGASWADYDRDGKLDLYVSNMFSKAGRRITSQIAGLDDRVPYSAQGSLLFHNEGNKFRQVAGMGEKDLHVAKVGWSFGGLFVDADNDGYPDIYSASGYYTAPAATRSDRDL